MRMLFTIFITSAWQISVAQWQLLELGDEGVIDMDPLNERVLFAAIVVLVHTFSVIAVHFQMLPFLNYKCGILNEVFIWASLCRDLRNIVYKLKKNKYKLVNTCSVKDTNSFDNSRCVTENQSVRLLFQSDSQILEWRCKDLILPLGAEIHL